MDHKQKLSIQDWRETIIRAIKDAVSEIESFYYLHLLVLSWENFGLYLPLNGSLDLDLRTLHKDSGRAPSAARKARTDEYMKRVTIAINPIGTTARLYQAMYVLIYIFLFLHLINIFLHLINILLTSY